VLAKAPVAVGLALVENAYDETARVEAVPPGQFEAREEELLALARRWLPRLPCREADLLIVDEIGKEISGSGMDTNVVGRKRAFRMKDPDDQPQMRLIFVRGLSAHTHGNACGIGLADFTTSQLVRGMDYKATAINCLTAGYPGSANIPVYFDTDREVIEAALRILGTREPQDARILHIRNTLAVEEVEVSEPCLAGPKVPVEATVAAGPYDLTFDAEGNLGAV
jgi:hypothetical protein